MRGGGLRSVFCMSNFVKGTVTLTVDLTDGPDQQRTAPYRKLLHMSLPGRQAAASSGDEVLKMENYS